MGIRDAVGAVPAKPIIATITGITLLVAAWHGWSLHSVCSSRADITASLQSWAQTIQATPNKVFDMENITDTPWTQLRISQGSTSLGPSQNCPFGWHWNNEERKALAKAGQLTLIGFFNNGSLVDIADFDSNWAWFETGDQAINRGAAKFKSTSGSNQLILVEDTSG